MHGPTNHARNQWIDICAPSKDIMAAIPGYNTYREYGLKSGTSYAAPFVSGSIGLMLSYKLSTNSKISPFAIETILKETADPIADGYLYQGLLGAGRLNVYKAILRSDCWLSIFNEEINGTRIEHNKCVIDVHNTTVNPGATLDLKATERVIINEGFKVEAGATFIIR